METPPWLSRLACPVCLDQGTENGLEAVVVPGSRPASVRCVRGHAFNVARQGYLSLTTGRRIPGDTLEMVQARERVWEAGLLDPLARGIVDALELHDEPDPFVVDVAGGPGHYLRRVVERFGWPGICLDSSTPALKRAARQDPRMGAALSDAWGTMPLPEGSVSVVLSVFGPRNPTEFLRVLRPQGLLVVAGPGKAHLGELLEGLKVAVDPNKAARLDKALGMFSPLGADVVQGRVEVPAALAVDLLAMGPAAFHHTRRELEVHVGPDPVEVTLDFMVSRFRPKAGE